MNREEKFEETIKANGDHIFRICNYYFDDPADRDDAVQEVLSKIWQALPAFRGEAKMSTWVYRIAVNTCLSFIRSEQKRKRMLGQYPLQPVFQEDPFKPDEQGELEAVKISFFRTFIRTISLIDRSLVSLYLEELTTKEISDVTGLTESNVRVRIHRIKEAVKKQWEEKHHGIG